MGKAASKLCFQIKRDAQGNMDLIGTIENFNEAMSDTTDIDERAKIIQDSFGDEGGSISLLLDNLDNLKASCQDVKANSNGVVNDNYQKFIASTGGQMAVFGNNIKMIGTAFSEALFPAVNMVLKPLAHFAKLVTDGIREYPLIAEIIGGVAVGIGVYALGLGVATAAQWAMNAAMLANPIGLVVAGLVVGATMIYKYWEPIKAFFVDIWNGIKSAFGSYVAFWLKGVRGITSIIPDSLLSDGFTKSLDESIKKYENLGKVVKQQKFVAPKLQGDESIGLAIKQQAKAFEVPKKLKQKITQAVAVTALATNIATAQTPKITQQATTITAPITVQATANPQQTAEQINAHLQKLQSDNQFDEDEL